MKLLFLDESGDHSLDRIDMDYPVFVLGGVIIDRTYYRETVEPRIKQLKDDYFDDEVVLHTTDIIRGKNGFEVLNDPDIRKAFYSDLNAMMQELEYTVVACAIKKDAHLEQYGPHAADPYAYSLEVVVERFVEVIGEVDHGGMIFAEKRRPDLDRDLEMTWRELRQGGCSYASAKKVDGRIIDLSLKDKRVNMVGLELADLVVSPIGRAVIGKPRANREKVDSAARVCWNQSMPRAYSVDLRERSLRALASGIATTEVARLFDVSVSSLARWRQQQRVTGELTPGRATGRPRAIGAIEEPALAIQVAATPDATLAEHCAQWAAAHGVTLSPTTMGRTLQRLGLPLKKRP